MPRKIPKPKPPTYPHADHELSADEIRTLYGPLLERFYRALQEDVGLLAEFAEKANEITIRQERHRAATLRYAQRERAKAQREIANTTKDAAVLRPRKDRG